MEDVLEIEKLMYSDKMNELRKVEKKEARRELRKFEKTAAQNDTYDDAVSASDESDTNSNSTRRRSSVISRTTSNDYISNRSAGTIVSRDTINTDFATSRSVSVDPNGTSEELEHMTKLNISENQVDTTAETNTTRLSTTVATVSDTQREDQTKSRITEISEVSEKTEDEDEGGVVDLFNTQNLLRFQGDESEGGDNDDDDDDDDDLAIPMEEDEEDSE
ncbi:unnamed protein product [Ambrosiozyma monospora]|uniref:Unnamed protein product n=1 Tax=Ambrosiozyma monospora TaxID=43982 RepID=A0A9W6Z3E4_AMBMO|nr:unnamed protein product [Ambrosiozyma monospora]